MIELHMCSDHYNQENAPLYNLHIFDTLDLNDIFGVIYEDETALEARKNRENIRGFEQQPQWGQLFVAGDIIQLNVDKGPYAHLLEGICLSIKKRSFLNRNTVILVRNVVAGVPVEITASYYYNRLYKCGFSDYKRKQFEYLSDKLYYLRSRDNLETRIKFAKVSK